MKGEILHFDKTGLIVDPDGHRYAFTERDWKDTDRTPKKGVKVDFEVDESNQKAVSVFPLQPGRKPLPRVAFILVGVFFGALGIHNFLAGYTYKAIAQLLITGLSVGTFAFVSWIWAVIEVSTVTEDAHGMDFV